VNRQFQFPHHNTNTCGLPHVLLSLLNTSPEKPYLAGKSFFLSARSKKSDVPSPSDSSTEPVLDTEGLLKIASIVEGLKQKEGANKNEGARNSTRSSKKLYNVERRKK